MNLYKLITGEITQQEYLNYHNITISYEKLPSGINGSVFLYGGIYNVFINKYLSYYKKRKTVLHELAHVELNQLGQANKDLFAFKVDKYEDDADRYVKLLLESKKML